MIQNLVSLRFIFIFLIYLSHAGAIGFPPFDFGGEVGVAFFFMLSGFVLSLRYGSKIEQQQFQHKRFVWHQLSKFYPLHILLIAIMVILGWRNIDSDFILKLIPSIFLIQSWIPDVDYYFVGNAVSWFLADILFLYIVFPYIYKGMMHKRWKNVLMVLGIIFAVYVLYITAVPKERFNDLIYAPPLLRTIDFALGIGAYRLLPKAEKLIKSTQNATLFELIAIGIGIITYYVYIVTDYRYRCVLLLLPMCLTCILVFSASDKYTSLLTRLLHSRWLLFCGGLTFELFLMHNFITWNVRVVMNKVGLQPPFLLALIICLGTMILCCWLTKRYFTDRMARLLSRK